MIKLYIKDNCRYSRKALDAMEKYHVPFEEKNIKDPAVATELLELGGKRQVPFLVDEDPCAAAHNQTPCLVDDDVELYESDDIVKYVEEHFGNMEAGDKESEDSGPGTEGEDATDES